MAGQANFRIIGAATTRSRAGCALAEIDLCQETERAIRTAVQAAQKMAQVRVESCDRGAGRRAAAQVRARRRDDADHRHRHRRLRGRGAGRLRHAGSGAGREVLHAQPVNFSLDHRTGLSDPRGHVGNRLSVDMHLLTIEAHAIETLLHCVKRCDLELAGLASAPYVSAVSSLVEDEQELGAGLHRHGRWHHQSLDLHEEAHDLRRYRADGRRPCDRRHQPGPARSR